MKVVHINSVYGIGSTGRIVESIHSNLLNDGIESTVIVGRNHPKFNIDIPRNTVIDLYSLPKVIMSAIPSVLFDSHGLHSKKNTMIVINYLKTNKPEIVHLHNIHGFYINYKLLFEYLNSTDIKVIWTLHDCWAFTSSCSHYTYYNNYKWKDGIVYSDERLGYPYRLINRNQRNAKLKKQLVNKNVTIVTPSIWLEGEVSKSYLKDNELIVINNGVELNDFYPDSQPQTKKILLGVASAWTKQKGYKEYIKLSKLISCEYQIVLIGVSNKQIRKLKKYNINGISKTSSIDELRTWYSSSFFLINLTLEDNYPTVNLEAVSCGLRVLGYDSGGNKETIQGYGEVVSQYKINEIYELIRLNKEYIKEPHFHNTREMYDEYKKLYVRK